MRNFRDRMKDCVIVIQGAQKLADAGIITEDEARALEMKAARQFVIMSQTIDWHLRVHAAQSLRMKH